MNVSQYLSHAEAETQCFASVVREIFHGEPWDSVEEYARRAWTLGQFGDGKTWDEVQEQIRSALGG